MYFQGIFFCQSSQTESLLHSALERAHEIDAMTVAQRRALPLCGVPVSLKDSVDVEGVDTTNGLAAKVNKPCADSAVIVQIMVRAGAVPFVKTNIPQTLMSFECSNPLYGRTTNPYRCACLMRTILVIMSNASHVHGSIA